jgi:hypothetical protein
MGRSSSFGIEVVGSSGWKAEFLVRMLVGGAMSDWQFPGNSSLPLQLAGSLVQIRLRQT